MSEIFLFLGLGFVLGLRHALEGDHIAAVGTMVRRQKKGMILSWLGFVWGVGHTSTLFLAAALVVLFRIAIPHHAALWFELAVGAVLILFGVNLLRRMKDDKVHIHTHKHDGLEHSHLHSHKEEPEHRHLHRPLLMGALHGLAGSAALMLIVLGATNGGWQALAFVLIFGLGSAVSMQIVSMIIGAAFHASEKLSWLSEALTLAASSFSIFFGIILIYEIGKNLI